MSSYSINGVPLTNPSLGWIERAGSVPYAGDEVVVTRIIQSGRDGAVVPPGRSSPTLLTFVINTPPEGLEALNSLFGAQSLTLTRADKPGISAQGYLLSSTPDRVFARNEWIDKTFLVEIPGAAWRDNANVTSTPATVASSVTVNSLLPGLSAPVQDAIIRVSGAATGVQVTDSSGAWFVYPGTIPAGSYLRFHSDTGRAWITTTDAWSGGTEVSGAVDYGGPRDRFEITPLISGGNPSSRAGRLTVTASSAIGSTIEVRGKRAYRL